MAEAALSFTLGKLSDLAIQTVFSLLGVGEQVTDLSKKLERIRSFLRDAAEKQYTHEYSKPIRQWISEIREVAHDSEDAIEYFEMKVASTPRSLKWSPAYLCNLDRLRRQISAIQERLRKIEETRKTYEIKDDKELVKKENVERRRRVHHWETDKHVMGLEDAMKTLIPKVVSGGRELVVVGIVGMGGSGKSTLAREVYNSRLVRKRFGQRRAWICVTREFNPTEVMKEVVKQLAGRNEAQNIEKLPESDVRQKAHEQLSGRSYFVVLDDVWRQEDWKYLVTAFPDEPGKASRILVTSRCSDIPSGAKYIHKHEGLNSEKGWQLLLKMALVNDKDFECPPESEGTGREISEKCPPKSVDTAPGLEDGREIEEKCPPEIVNAGTDELVDTGRQILEECSSELVDRKIEILEECPPELVDVGQRILDKCNGLPLAIRVMGGLLQQAGQLESEWEKVFEGMGSNFGTNDDDDPVMSILELSYHDLPPHLKSCFLCLSFFKEDAAIPARDLTLIWIAEGFIHHEEAGADDKSMEDKARSYLHNLINRNMIQVKDCGKDLTQVVNCQVHDLLYDLSIKKAREEISFDILKESKLDSKSWEKCRHCVMYSDGNLLSFKKNPHLRSVVVHRSDTNKVGDIPSNFWKSFEILRLLNLEGFGLEKLHEYIRKMVALRYLGLRNNKLKKLPKALGYLKNLQHLDIAGNSKMEVPNIIWKLEGLRHLFVESDIICKKPLRLNTLKKLQTLSLVLTDNIVVEHLAALDSLCKLGIRIGEGLDARKLFDSMAELKSFVSIHMILGGGATDGLGNLKYLTRMKITYFVRKLSDLPQNLSYVSLIKTWLEEDPMAELGKLPNLVYLKLDDALTIKLVVVKISNGGFPKLEELHLLNLLKLVKIQVEDGGMMKLERLKISNCERLKIVPETEEMRLFRSLQELKMLRVSLDNKKKFEGKEYKDILSRIPSVEISEIKY